MNSYLYKNKLLLFLNVILTSLSVVFVSIIPLTTKYVIESYNNLNFNKLILISVIYVLSVLLFLLFEYLKKKNISRLQKKINTQFKNDLFKTILNSNHSDINSFSSGEYVNLLTHDVDVIYQKYYGCIIDMIISIISFFCYTIIMSFIDWKLTICIVLSCFLSLVIPKIVGEDIDNKEKETSDSEAAFINTISVLMKGTPFFSSESSNPFFCIFKNSNQKLENSVFKLNNSISFSNIFSGFSLYFINIVTFILGLIFIYYGLSEMSSFVAIIAYIELLSVPTRDIIYEIITLKSTKKIRKKFIDTFQMKRQNTIEMFEFESMTLKNVTLSFEEKTIFEKLNYRFEKGKKYAIVGKNGSGKSSLIKVITQELCNYKGEINVNDIDYNNVSFHSFGMYLPEDTLIFDGSFEENITLFDTFLFDVEKEINIIGLQHLKNRLLSHHEDNISSGEKSKIAILRAINSKKQVLVFDEIFANVDEKSEKELTDYLLSLDKTVLIVTHNLSDENLEKFDFVINM